MENKEIQEVTPEVQEQPKKKQPSKKAVDQAKYDKFTNLKFTAISGTKLSEEIKKEMAELEAELKGCLGKIPIRTVRAAIKNEQILLVEGIPVPENIENIVVNSVYYFGK
jgi:hypothetical protein